MQVEYTQKVLESEKMIKNLLKTTGGISPKKLLSPFILFAFLALSVIAVNLAGLSKEMVEIHRQRKLIPFYFSGFKFLGLEDVFRGVAYAGYYTDKDLSLKQNSAQYAQAQYILAPTIVDLNNTTHLFTLLDCTGEEKAFEKIKEIHAVAIKKNAFGVVLARKIK